MLNNYKEQISNLVLVIKHNNMTKKKLKELRGLLSELLSEYGYSEDSESIEIKCVLEIIEDKLTSK